MTALERMLLNLREIAASLVIYEGHTDNARKVIDAGESAEYWEKQADKQSLVIRSLVEMLRKFPPYADMSEWDIVQPCALIAGMEDGDVEMVFTTAWPEDEVDA